MPKVIFAERFLADVSSIYSDALVAEVMEDVSRIAAFPEIGRVLAPEITLNGMPSGVRKFPVGPFDLLYAYDRDSDVLKVEALIHQRRIH